VGARATAFELDVRDEITYRNLHYVNLARARSRGTEISIQAALGRGFRVEGAYSRSNAVDLANGSPQLRSPKAVGSASVFWQGDKANLALSLRAQSSQADTAFDGFSPVTRPSYAVADLAGGYDLGHRLVLTARIENLADAAYQQAYGFGTPGRAVFLGLRVAH
jgi:vitamin B12 transporter